MFITKYVISYLMELLKRWNYLIIKIYTNMIIYIYIYIYNISLTDSHESSLSP